MKGDGERGQDGEDEHGNLSMWKRDGARPGVRRAPILEIPAYRDKGRAAQVLLRRSLMAYAADEGGRVVFTPQSSVFSF